MIDLKSKNHLLSHKQEFYDLFAVNPKDYDKITIDEFVKEVSKTADSIKFFDNPDLDRDARNSFKGDALEIFAEIFFNVYFADPALGITNYTPIEKGEDYGVDGIGTNVNDQAAAIQVKYRENPMEMIEYPDVAKTVMAATWKHKIDTTKKASVYIFTTGKGVNFRAEEISEDRMVVINREVIADKVNHNLTFWKILSETVYKALDEV